MCSWRKLVSPRIQIQKWSEKHTGTQREREIHEWREQKEENTEDGSLEPLAGYLYFLFYSSSSSFNVVARWHKTILLGSFDILETRAMLTTKMAPSTFYTKVKYFILIIVHQR